MNLFYFIPGYTSLIYDTGRQPALIMLIAFLVTYILTRGYTRIARKTGWGSASFGGVHTHHLVFGLIAVLIAGASLLAFLPTNDSLLHLLLAATFGAGAALILDEFALIFHLKDVYWEKEGRKSVDAVVVATIFGFLFLLHTAPFGGQPNNSKAVFTTIILINLFFVIIAAVKGKLFMAIFGVFVPNLALIAAIRLAEPSSIWAKKFYDPNGKKISKSIDRYKKYEDVWRTKKEKIWDAIGGKTGRPPIN